MKMNTRVDDTQYAAPLATAPENVVIPASAAALNLWKACCYIRELVALHRVRGPLTPSCEQSVREATAFVDVGGAVFVDAVAKGGEVL